jgi:hypothetical protein
MTNTTPSVMRSARRSPLAPAYYLGRPADMWIQALDRRTADHPSARRRTEQRPKGCIIV